MFRLFKFRIFKRALDRFEILLHSGASVRERTFFIPLISHPLYLHSKIDQARMLTPSHLGKSLDFSSNQRSQLLRGAKLQVRDGVSRPVSTPSEPAFLNQRKFSSKNRAPIDSLFKDQTYKYAFSFLYNYFRKSNVFFVLINQRTLEYAFDRIAFGLKPDSSVSLLEKVRLQANEGPARVEREARFYSNHGNRMLAKFLDLSSRKKKATDRLASVREDVFAKAFLLCFFSEKDPSFSRFELFRFYGREIARTLKKSETGSSFRASIRLVAYISRSRLKLDVSSRASYLATLVFKKTQSSFALATTARFFRSEHRTKSSQIECCLRKNVFRSFAVCFTENGLYEANSRIVRSTIRGTRRLKPLQKENERLVLSDRDTVRLKKGENQVNSVLRINPDFAGSSSSFARERPESIVTSQIKSSKRSLSRVHTVEQTFPSGFCLTFKNVCREKSGFDFLTRAVFYKSNLTKIAEFYSLFPTRKEKSLVSFEKNSLPEHFFFVSDLEKQDRKDDPSDPTRTFSFEPSHRSMVQKIEAFSFREVGAEHSYLFGKIFDEVYGLAARCFRKGGFNIDGMNSSKPLFYRALLQVFDHASIEESLVVAEFRSILALKNVIKSLASATHRKLLDRLTQSLYVWSYRQHGRFDSARIFEFESRVKVLLWRWSVRRHNNKSKGWVKAKYFARFHENWLFGTLEKNDRGRYSEFRFVYLPPVFQIFFSLRKTEIFKGVGYNP